MAASSSTLWTCKIIHRFGDPSTLWRLRRPFCGLVKLFTVLVIRPLYGGNTVHFCGLVKLFTVLVIRPLCGGYTVHFVAAIPSTLWTCKISHRFGDPSTLWRLYRRIYPSILDCIRRASCPFRGLTFVCPVGLRVVSLVG